MAICMGAAAACVAVHEGARAFVVANVVVPEEFAVSAPALRGASVEPSTSSGSMPLTALSVAVIGATAVKMTSAGRHRATRSRAIAVVRQAAGEAAAEGEGRDFTKPFPFSAVVGQEDSKLGLLLNLVDPGIGGVLIQGERGTGKSTAVRAVVRLLPEIPMVEGDRFNSDPNNYNTMSDEARARVDNGEQLPFTMRRTPFVELPLGATEDRVTGTIDIERALMEGGKAFEPGILARVNRGILYIDEVNLLDDQLVDVLLDSAAGGWNTVEREGISIRHPARFILVGTAHPDEGDLRPQLLDRFGLTVNVRTANPSETRLKILQRCVQWTSKPEKVEKEFGKQDEAVKKQIVDARERLRSTSVPRDLALRISKICSRLNIDGLRGDIVTNRTARALAALDGRTEVTQEDVRRVAPMCLQHRLRKDVVSDTLDNSGKVIEALVKEFGEGMPTAKPAKEPVNA